MGDVAAVITAIAGFMSAIVTLFVYLEERKKRVQAEARERQAEENEQKAKGREKRATDYITDLERSMEGLEEKFTNLQMQVSALTSAPLDPVNANPPSIAMWTLDTILDLLDRHHQRTTYGAVAGVLGTGPNIVMSGRPKNPRHSWVVNRETNEPTGYEEHEKHPQLRERDQIINNSTDLSNWLGSH